MLLCIVNVVQESSGSMRCYVVIVLLPASWGFKLNAGTRIEWVMRTAY